ncbi:hypothetical protein [Streptomyces sp. NPDC005752]|uniref:hypothetical protein n=1 Tax=Streptomyces sp. NPDC005752 TaxID=3157065 RepID=UPI0033FF6F18
MLLEIHAPVTAELQELGEQVRRRVLRRVHDRLWMVLTSIDIRITDLTDATDEPEEGRSR